MSVTIITMIITSKAWGRRWAMSPPAPSSPSMDQHEIIDIYISPSLSLSL